MESNIIKFSQKNISKIKSGMFWYNDDTFSVELLNNKTVKAVVELVDTDLGIVYGDIFIPDKKMKWLEVEKYIKFFNEFSHAQDYRIKDYLFRQMNNFFSLEQVRLFVREFSACKYVASQNAKICLYDDFQYLDVKSSADKIKTAFEKLHKTSRFDSLKNFFQIELRKNYWTETAMKREKLNEALTKSSIGIKMYVRPVLAMAVFEW